MLFKCDILLRIIRAAPLIEYSKRWEKVAECCRIFGFNSPARQFIFNALS